MQLKESSPGEVGRKKDCSSSSLEGFSFLRSTMGLGILRWFERGRKWLRYWSLKFNRHRERSTLALKFGNRPFFLRTQSATSCDETARGFFLAGGRRVRARQYFGFLVQILVRSHILRSPVVRQGSSRRNREIAHQQATARWSCKLQHARASASRAKKRDVLGLR